jgi:DNA processing protein
MERDELAAWLRLTLSPGVGNQTGCNLLAAFGSPQAVFSQSRLALQQVVSVAQVDALLTEPPQWFELVTRTWDWLQAGDMPGVQRQVVPLGNPLYPPTLLNIEDPPLLLYLMGQLDQPLADPFASCLAIVGSRNPTPQGLANARNFALACANAGLTVVSGLALGVDGAAHEGALAAEPEAAGRWATIAVVGTGLDRVYPRKHLALAHHIAQRGLLISEYPLGTPPLAANFPKRNRIIAGLSLGTLVVEAALKSGSLITARLTAEQGKEVFAIPGSIHAPQSHGCHALIREGAKLVETAQDILEELPLSAAAPGAAMNPLGSIANQPGAAASRLLEALGHDPVTLDALVARTGIDAAGLQVQLLELELSGDVSRLPGGLFQRFHAA